MSAFQVSEADLAVFPVGLHTGRLVLREFTRDDFSGVHAIVGDARVTKWLSFDSRSLDQADAMLSGVLERQRAEPRSEYYLAITPAEDQDTIFGFVRLGLSGIQAADLGYALRPDAQGHGYAREATATMLDFAFRTLGLHRIVANIGPTNAASIRLVRSLGLVQEGTIRDHVFTNGEWRDSESFSLLAHEWTTTTCERCGSRVPPSPRGGRSRQFCSPRCRQAAYRERRRYGLAPER